MNGAGTVARVRNWAAEKKFGMSPEEAGEHLLQLSGTQERPTPGTHIGALVTHGACMLAFDLVADERVHGAVEVPVRLRPRLAMGAHPVRPHGRRLEG